jgi:hypothetical protein
MIRKAGMRNGHNADLAADPAVISFGLQVLKESKFKEHGRITPGEPDQLRLLHRALKVFFVTEEFVVAGDFLTYQFPTFQWFVFSIALLVENAEVGS